MKRASLLLAVGLAISARAAPVLSLDEALRTAKENRPSLRQARAAVEAAQARADQSRAGLLPQVSAQATYSRSTANFVPRPGSVPSQFSTQSPNSFATYDFFTTGLSASQLVFDFMQTPNRWRAAKATAEAQGESERAAFVDAMFSVRDAFFNARAAKALVGVAQETLTNQERRLKQVQGFVEVGTRPEIDLAQLRTERANAKVQLINTENAYDTARAALNQSMGVERSTDYEVADETLSPVDVEASALDALVSEAVERKPELAALSHQVRAQELTQRSIRGDYFPSVGVSTGLTDNGRALDQLGWNWNAGVNFSWPLFEGLANRARESEAEANLRSLKAQLDALRQQTRLDVDRARLAVRAAKASLSATDEALTAARERLRLSEGRYQTGVGNIIELQDSQLAVTSAAAQRVQAEYRLASARADLLRALGREG